MSEILKAHESLLAKARAQRDAEAAEAVKRRLRTEIEAARDRGEMSEREVRRALATLAPEPYRSEALAAIAAEEAEEAAQQAAQSAPQAPISIPPASVSEPAKSAGKSGKRRL